MISKKGNEFRIHRKLMGCAFELIISDPDKSHAASLLEEGVQEIARIEKLLSEFKNDSVVSEINRNAGIRSVKVVDEVFQLIERCVKLSDLTQGAFDITAGPLKALYNFNREELNLPDPKTIERARNYVGYKKIHLGKNNSVYLERKGMFISFAAIGKGYAADRVKKLWLKKNVKSGVINASGDLTVIGTNSDGKPWKIGIPDPDHKNNILLFIPVNEGSVATSGDYEQYFIKDDIRYSHTIDPKTGIPVTGIKSVTISGPGAELCDALATAVSVMGPDIGLHFIDQLPGVHCLIIDSANQMYFSKSINFEKIS